MSIKRKLIILLTTLSLFILIIIGNNVIEEINEKSELNRAEHLNNLSTVLSKLIHETQKERGASAGYLASKGMKFRDVLTNQKISTNKALQVYKDYINNKENLQNDNSLLNEIDFLNNALNELDSIRNKVLSQNISVNGCVKFYTDMNRHILNITSLNAKLSTIPTLIKSLDAYSNFLKSKERAGIERAVMSSTFASNKFANGIFAKWNRLIAEQNSFMESFLSIASEDMKMFYTNEMNSPTVSMVQNMRNIAMKKSTEGNFGVDPNFWFSTITKKINLLKKVDDYIYKTNQRKIEELISDNIMMLVVNLLIGLFAFVIIIIAFIINKNILRDLGLLENGMTDFFNYLNKKTTNVNTITKNSNDEIGQMIETINQNIFSTKKKLDEDNQIF